MTREQEIKPLTSDDIVLVADVGRSAQGWLSYMLCYILNARFIEPYDLLKGAMFTKSKVIAANTRGNLPGRPVGRYKLVVKTHGPPGQSFDLTGSVVFLTRDPRDVAVSYYFMSKNRRNAGDTSLSTLLHSTAFFGALWIAYRWRRHYRSWQNINTFKVRYEDLRRDTEGTLFSILQHFGVEADINIVRESIDLMSFENTYGRKRGVEDKSNSEARKGQVGDYRNHLSDFTNKVFWSICGKEAEEAGYRFDGSTTIEPGNG